MDSKPLLARSYTTWGQQSSFPPNQCLLPSPSARMVGLEPGGPIPPPPFRGFGAELRGLGVPATGRLPCPCRSRAQLMRVHVDWMLQGEHS